MVEMMDTERTATSQTVTDELLTQLFVESGAAPGLTPELRAAVAVLASTVENVTFTLAAQKIAEDCTPLLELPSVKLFEGLANVPKSHGLWLVQKANEAHDADALVEHGADRLAYLMAKAVAGNPT